jgi:preprotein translocase subunit SecD
MTRGMVYKLLFILFLIGFSIVLILPTFGTKKMRIDFTREATQEQKQEFKKRFSSDRFRIEEHEGYYIIIGTNITDAIMNEVKTFPGVFDSKFLKHWAEEYLLAKKITLGLDLQGGMQLVLRANYEKIEKKTGQKLTDKDKHEITQQSLELIRNRIDKFGVSEPSIRPRGNESIEIQLPGIKDPKGVKQAIGTTGRVEYRLVDDMSTKMAAEWIEKNIKDKKIPDDKIDQDNLLAQITREIKLSSKSELLFYYMRDKDTKKIHPAYPVALEKEVALAGSDINKAWVGTDEYGGLAVHFTTTSDGATKFSEVTSKKNHGKKLAIIIDDKVRSAPSINVQISTGQALINGDFTKEEVDTLARIIKEGALPVDLSIIEERTVGPSLGQDSIDSGLKAMVVSFITVGLFMLVYYKVAGFLSIVGLLLNFIFMFAILSWLGFTLTLPGIAGFILTVGMAVDANVINYERIKEELRHGKSVRMAIVNGFDRAFWAILDSNLTTIITALMLSQFGSGPVKGFAVTLMIGIITSMFAVLYITRFIYEIISQRKNIKKLSI